jgi:Holliday junction resolvase RusA-like endonuclease
VIIVSQSRSDADGISAKAAIDGLVHAGLLKDDSPKYVKEVSYSQEKGEPEETIITLTEVDSIK